MKEYKHNGHKIKVFNSIEDMPIERFRYFNRYLVTDAGIGGDIEAVASKLGAVVSYIDLGRTDEAKTATRNIIFAINNCIEMNSPEMMSFVCLVHSVDGVNVGDRYRTPEGCSEVIDQLKKVKVSFLKSVIENVKKNLTWKWKRTSQKG